MSDPILNFSPRLFLVCLGAESAVVLADPDRRAGYPATGLTIRQDLGAGGVAHLFIAAPDDLAGLADLGAASLMKPVCLPLSLTHVGSQRIGARLSDDPNQQRVAQRILRAITHPDPAAQPPVPSRNLKTR